MVEIFLVFLTRSWNKQSSPELVQNGVTDLLHFPGCLKLPSWLFRKNGPRLRHRRFGQI